MEKNGFFLPQQMYNKLFDPKKFKLHPEMWHTGCYKGFIISFRVTDDLLYLDRLIVHCSNNKYPPINNVEPEKYDGSAMEYKNINLPLPYSGTIIVGSDLL